jgi:hypothetical protein
MANWMRILPQVSTYIVESKGLFGVFFYMSESNQRLAEMDFNALVLGFSSAALGYLGFSETGEQAPDAQNLELAAQNIEILRILEDKTAGNLTSEEQHLLKAVLADLRMRYVEAAKF